MTDRIDAVKPVTVAKSARKGLVAMVNPARSLRICSATQPFGVWRLSLIYLAASAEEELVRIAGGYTYFRLDARTLETLSF